MNNFISALPLPPSQPSSTGVHETNTLSNQILNGTYYDDDFTNSGSITPSTINPNMFFKNFMYV